MTAPLLNDNIELHFIGHLQKNKVKKAVRLFDMIQTVDSASTGEEINKQCERIHRIMPVLIEINSGREAQKHGVFPEHARELVNVLSTLPYIRIEGIMTMGPFTSNPENARPYFREAKNCFEQIRTLKFPHVHMSILSMGMTDTYRVAIEEGANMIRIGNSIFGSRKG
ncbi:YggS family pyridoxal phosphate enzyme, partial [bacterium I07]